MNDPFLQAQAHMAFQYPLETVLFVLGGLALYVGIFMGAVSENDKWKQRGIALVVCGSWIAMPGVLPMALQFLGEANPTTSVFNFLYNSLIYAGPILGISGICWEWYRTSRKFNTAS